MTVAVVLILGVLWVAVLMPPILRARSQQSRGDSVGDFHYRLNVLGRANGSHRAQPVRLAPVKPVLGPVGHRQHQMSPMQKRRRDVLLMLLGACAGTLFLAVLSRMTPLFVLHVLCDGALGVYVYLLVQLKNRGHDQRAKVSFLGAAYRRGPTYAFSEPDRGGTSESAGPRLVPLRQTALR